MVKRITSSSTLRVEVLALITLIAVLEHAWFPDLSPRGYSTGGIATILSETGLSLSFCTALEIFTVGMAWIMVLMSVRSTISRGGSIQRLVKL
jgi:hypothetical protein